jgi:two-component system cell cycle response regulator
MKLPKSHRLVYSFFGAILGIAAPAIVSFLIHSLDQGRRDTWIYMGAAIAGAIVLGWIGHRFGSQNDRLEKEKNRATVIAIHDGLTGLYNHRHLHQHLAAEVERAKRCNVPLTCLMLDIDNFKAINDQFGHPYGDDVLWTVAHIIRENIRRVDMAGRYGGEEFMVVMPFTTSLHALPVAERIRTEVQAYPFRAEGTSITVTLSIGIATYEPASAQFIDKTSLLKATDEALYSAKNSGRNKTYVWKK